MGEDSVLQTPRHVTGGRYIRIGDRSLVSSNGCLSAYDKCESVPYRPQISIGNDVYIGGFSTITCISRIAIGDGCIMSEFVYLSDHAHGMNPEAGLISKQALVSKGDVTIGEHTFVGYQACILSGVKLGKHCVVGANSVVTRSFPDFSMVAGAPARLIKVYSFEHHEWIPASQEGSLSVLSGEK